MSRLIREKDWATTPLGALADWSDTLVATINLALESSNTFAIYWGQEQILLYNDEYRTLLHEKHPDALGKRGAEVWAEAWDVISPQIEAAYGDGASTEVAEALIPILVGGQLQNGWYSYSFHPIYEDGRIVGVGNPGRDVSAVVQARIAIQKSDARLNQILGATMDAIVSIDRDWKFSYLNPAAVKAYGADRDLLGRSLWEEFPDAVYEGSPYLKHYNRAMNEGVAGSFEVFYADPLNIWTQLEVYPTSDGIVTFSRDITARKLVEETLRTKSKRLAEIAAIVDSSDDAILTKDLTGTITSWNTGASRIFGYTAEEIIGSSILRLIPKELHSDEPIIIAKIREGQRIEHFETVRLTKEGRRLDVALTVSPVKDDDGNVVGASKIVRDISNKKRLEGALLQSEKISAAGRMASTIAHEVNNPLQAITNLLHLLRPLITDTEGLGYLSTAEEEIARVSHIAKQTLGFYRENSAAGLSSVSELVQQAITIYEPRCAANRIDMERSLRSTNKIVLRRGEIMQVISNLIANSMYAMSAGGTLFLSTEDSSEAGGGVVLTVRDTGAGIAAQDLPRVFDAFFTTRSSIGTGIGLFIAKQFVEGHGGRIEIESTQIPIEHGTSVRIFLPLHTSYDLNS
jgi:PAS domain S-box-containing protein